MCRQEQQGQAALLQSAVLQPVTLCLAAAGQVGCGSIHLNGKQRLFIHFVVQQEIHMRPGTAAIAAFFLCQ